jgi:hypothetical protein
MELLTRLLDLYKILDEFVHEVSAGPAYMGLLCFFLCGKNKSHGAFVLATLPN